MNHDLIRSKSLNEDSLLNVFSDYLYTQEGIAMVFRKDDLKSNDYKFGIRSIVKNGFNASRSSDMQFILKPNWMVWFSKTGTTHGTPYEYDTHVPLIFYGWKIKNSKSDTDVKITDIAPTVAKLLGIEKPNGSTGNAIGELLK